jgi:hypothetical protein
MTADDFSVMSNIQKPKDTLSKSDMSSTLKIPDACSKLDATEFLYRKVVNFTESNEPTWYIGVSCNDKPQLLSEKMRIKNTNNTTSRDPFVFDLTVDNKKSFSSVFKAMDNFEYHTEFKFYKISSMTWKFWKSMELQLDSRRTVFQWNTLPSKKEQFDELVKNVVTNDTELKELETENRKFLTEKLVTIREIEKYSFLHSSLDLLISLAALQKLNDGTTVTMYIPLASINTALKNLDCLSLTAEDINCIYTADNFFEGKLRPNQENW